MRRAGAQRGRAARGPGPQVACYLQHLVGVRAVLLGRGAPEDSFCRYLLGFGDPRDPGHPSRRGKLDLFGPLTSKTVRQETRQDNETGNQDPNPKV